MQLQWRGFKRHPGPLLPSTHLPCKSVSAEMPRLTYYLFTYVHSLACVKFGFFLRWQSKLMASKWLSSISYKLISFPRSRHESKARAGATLQSRDHHLREFHAAFHYFDRNGDGKISSEELRAFFASMGEDMSEVAADGVIADHDRDGDRLLDFEEFMLLVDKDVGNEVEDLRGAFEMFEMDKGSGCITPNGLQRILDRLGDPRTYDECAAMIRAFDLDGNGVLDFNEFHAMMT